MPSVDELLMVAPSVVVVISMAVTLPTTGRSMLLNS